jgi:acyl-CoA synthetase (NDP forming)
MFREIIDQARTERRRSLDEVAGKALLKAFGIPVPRSVKLAGPDDCVGRLGGIAPPYAVKVVSREILHKSDVGGVTLGVLDAAGVAGAIAEMARKPDIVGKQVEAWLVEEMIPAGREIVVGGLNDPQFGPMVMVGLGGIFVEVLKDVSFRICPITRTEAQDMLAELKSSPLLDGIRGEARLDREALIDILFKVGGPTGLMMATRAEFAEVDLNPIIVCRVGATAADARFILSSAQCDCTPAPPDEAVPALERFRPLFEPKTIAVLGASTTDVGLANTFIRRVKEFGYAGHIYPIHPSAAEIEGFEAYPSLARAPQPVDYAYVAIGAARVPDAVAEANGRCRFAQVIASGFGETREGRALERALIEKARAASVRILGPNTLGTYSPRGGLTFPENAPKTVGSIGIVSQSGGLSIDIIKRGEWRGLRFSGLVTIGNCADVTAHELVEYYLDDPQTKAIGLYLEDMKDGRVFFDLLRSSKARKPVLILKGGRSAQGKLAAQSHTGALAGTDEPWAALPKQLPVALVATLNEFLDGLLALQCLTLKPSKPTTSVALFGNGGGSSVLGSDAFAAAGLEVLPFASRTRERLESLKLAPGTSVTNPIDTPVGALLAQDGRVAGEILDIVYSCASPDALAMHVNLTAFVGRGSGDTVENLLAVIEQRQKTWAGVAHFTLALRSDGSPQLDEKKRMYRDKAMTLGIPVFDDIPEMAKALAVVSHIEKKLADQMK